MKLKAEEIKRVCNKIVQVYRIRLDCLMKRDALIQEINSNFDEINSPEFYRRLGTYFRAEKKILKIAKREDKKGESNIAYAIEVVRAAGKQTGSKRFKVGSINLGERELSRFFEGVLVLLKYMEEDIEKVEVRLALEEYFLESKKENHFKKFIKEWSKEVKDNQRVIAAYEDILHSNSELITRIIQLKSKSMKLIGGAGTAGLLVAMAADALVGGVIILASTLSDFMVKLLPIFKYEFSIDKRDRKLLADLQHA